MLEKTARFFVDLYICSRVFIAAFGNCLFNFQFWNTRGMEMMLTNVYVKTVRSREETFVELAEDFNGVLDTVMWQENPVDLDDIITLNFVFQDTQSCETFLMWSIFQEV